VKSRRGYKGTSSYGKQPPTVTGRSIQTINIRHADDSVALTYGSGCPLLSANAATSYDSRLGTQGIISPESSGIVALQDPASGGIPVHLATTLAGKDQDLEISGPRTQNLGTKYRERCLEAFFQYFHDSHPFLPPRRLVLQMLRTRTMNHLETAMCYVGSQYVPAASAVAFALEFESLISGADVSNDGSVVQAMLLFAIGLDGNNDQKRALEILHRAQTLALQLGMHQHEYAVVNGAGSSVLEESWRRTWWELYIVDGIIAGLHQKSTFHLQDMVSSVPLPCEEKEYASGVSLV